MQTKEAINKGSMKSKVWDQVEIGIFSLHRPLLTWKTLTRTRQIHTPQLPGADALFISSNAYIKMEMYKIFLVQRNEKTACWHINRNTCTIYYNLLQSPCNKHDLCEDDFAAACCTVAFGLSFFLLCSVFFFFWISYWCSCYCVHLYPQRNASCAPSCSSSSLGTRPTQHKRH